MPIGWQVADFVLSTNTKATTQHQYAKTLRTVLRKCGWGTTPLLDLVISGLAVQANSVDIRHAAPATPAHVTYLIRQAWIKDRSGRLPLSIWLCWKTTSRWDDIRGLTKESFLLIDHDRHQIVIEWGDLKTNRLQRYRSTGFTVVQEDQQPLVTTMFQRLLRTMRRAEPLTTWTTAQFRTWLQSFPLTQHLSAHSLKRGAVDRLMEKACDGLFEPRLIPLLAKHQDPLWNFPETTIRYTSAKVAFARLMRTQDATRHI